MRTVLARALRSLMRTTTPAIVIGTVALLLGATPTRAAAQVTGHWDCGRSSQCATVMGAPSGDRSFSTMDECNRWGRTNIPGGYTCNGGGGGAGSFSLTGSPGAIVFRSAVGCGFGGAVLASLGSDVNGTSYAIPGAVALAGLCALGGARINARDWSRGGEMFVMTFAGCGMGYAVGAYMDGQHLLGTPEALKKQVGPDTAIGCGAGLLSGAIMPMRFRNVGLAGRRGALGLRIAW